MTTFCARPSRRRFFQAMGGSLAAAAVVRVKAAPAGGKKTVRIAEFSPSGARTGVAETEKIVRTDAEWKAQLTSDQYAVTRQAGTEPPFTGKYAESHDDGLYSCVCCRTILFDSRTKFESGTGWPSFWQPIAKENVAVRRDTSLGMVRDEVQCARCDAHLGHVFDDGPPPTHQRYCMNSVSLNFAPRGKG